MNSEIPSRKTVVTRAAVENARRMGEPTPGTLRYGIVKLIERIFIENPAHRLENGYSNSYRRQKPSSRG